MFYISQPRKERNIVKQCGSVWQCTPVLRERFRRSSFHLLLTHFSRCSSEGSCRLKFWIKSVSFGQKEHMNIQLQWKDKSIFNWLEWNMFHLIFYFSHLSKKPQEGINCITARARLGVVQLSGGALTAIKCTFPNHPHHNWMHRDWMKRKSAFAGRGIIPDIHISGMRGITCRLHL